MCYKPETTPPIPLQVPDQLRNHLTAPPWIQRLGPSIFVTLGKRHDLFPDNIPFGPPLPPLVYGSAELWDKNMRKNCGTSDVSNYPHDKI